MHRNHTSYEKHLHHYVTPCGATSDKWKTFVALAVSDKADVERYSDGNVESRQQNQPVPHGLEDAVMQQDKTGLHRSHLVLRQGWFLEHALKTHHTTWNLQHQISNAIKDIKVKLIIWRG